jgi:hypothetical protein
MAVKVVCTFIAFDKNGLGCDFFTHQTHLVILSAIMKQSFRKATSVSNEGRQWMAPNREKWLLHKF